MHRTKLYGEKIYGAFTQTRVSMKSEEMKPLPLGSKHHFLNADRFDLRTVRLILRCVQWPCAKFAR